MGLLMLFAAVVFRRFLGLVIVLAVVYFGYHYLQWRDSCAAHAADDGYAMYHQC